MRENTLHIDDELRQIVRNEGKVSTPGALIGRDDDLYKLGLSSLATVNVMLAIEARFGIEIPDEALTRETFRTIGALADLVLSLAKTVAA